MCRCSVSVASDSAQRSGRGDGAFDRRASIMIATHLPAAANTRYLHNPLIQLVQRHLCIIGAFVSISIAIGTLYRCHHLTPLN